MPTILIDADACPVKDEVYRVAARYALRVVLVANRPLATPSFPPIELVVVDQGLDAADDWIAAHAAKDSVVVTADIPLAARCLEAGATVLGTTGRELTLDGIGDAMAGRQLASDLREQGVSTRGPAPVQAKDRSRFASRLDAIVQRMRRDASLVAADEGASGSD